MKAKRVVIIAGNMGSGKSTLSQLLQERTGWKWLAMDNFRSSSNAKGFHGEQIAIDNFLQAILENERSIIETTAFGKTYPIFMALLRKHQVNFDMVKLICTPDQCHRRLMKRNSLPTFPKRYRLWDSLWMMDENLKKIQCQYAISSEKYNAQAMATIIINQVLNEETAPK